MRLITDSVRSSVAASGSCAKATRYCLSCAGTKPVGVCAKPNQVRRDQPAVDEQRNRARAQHPRHGADVAALDARERSG